MNARETIFDVYGDYLRFFNPPPLLSTITRLLEPLGHTPSGVRMALSRMRRDGWFEVEKDGREARYRATDQTLKYLDDGYTRIFSAPNQAWGHEWTVAFLSDEDLSRPDKNRLFRKLEWESFAPMTGNFWVSARQDNASSRDALERAGANNFHIATLRTSSLEEDRRIANTCWDLAAINSRRARFIETWSKLTSSADLTPFEAYLNRINLVTDYRRTVHDDPQLPAILSPAAPSPITAHQVFIETHDALAPTAVQFVLASDTPADTETET